MLSKCANPACNERFLYLHTGRLFALRRHDIHLPEHDFRDAPDDVVWVWLCARCSQHMTPRLDRQRHLVLSDHRPQLPLSA